MALTKLWTTKGLEKQTQCLTDGAANLGMKYIAVGDGAGSVPNPSVSDTALVNEVWRGEITEITDNAPQFTAMTYIPEDEGDFIMRELGIFDEDNNLLFTAQMDETPKYSTDSTGLIKEIGLKVVFELQNGLNAVIVDPSSVTATTQYVDDVIEEKISSANQTLENAIENFTENLPNIARYNAFSINSGEVTDEGEPDWLRIETKLEVENAYSSDGISDFTLNSITYFDDVEEAGEFVFTYDGSDWLLDSTAVTLSDYGISFTELFNIETSLVASGVESAEADYDTFMSAVNNQAGAYGFVYTYLTADNSNRASLDYTSDTLTSVTLDSTVYFDNISEASVFTLYWAITSVTNGEVIGEYEDGTEETITEYETEDGESSDGLVYEDTQTVYGWLLDGEEIDPADYGITVEGEPSEGDSITVEVEAVRSDSDFWTMDGNIVDISDYGLTYTGTPESGDIIIVTAQSLLSAGDTITVNVSEGTQEYYLETNGEFIATTAAGASYTLSDTLTYSISDLSEGVYNVYIDPVNLSLSVLDNTITANIAFPSDASEGDYLLNVSRVPYDLEEYASDGNISGLTMVHAGTLAISSDSGYELKLNIYNTNVIFWQKFKGLEDAITTLKEDIEEAVSTAESTASTAGLPDYSSAVSISLPYTCTKNGFVYAGVNGVDSMRYVYVNGKRVHGHCGYSGGKSVYSGSVFPVAKDDYITCDKTLGNYYFYPRLS